MALPPLGLYIHLPWCERKCPYCDFNSHAAVSIPENRYIDHLLQDLQQDVSLAQGRQVDYIFIGGGTPSLFSATGIERLLSSINALTPVAPAAEVTLEANPGSAEAEKFLGFREAGINRLSLGIQSFDDKCLTALGRAHSSDQAHAAIDFAKQAKFDSFNLDLMHGLPGQTRDMARADLASAIAHSPPHLSWYQLTIEANTAFYKQPPVLPIEDELADIQADGEALLAEAGLEQYEVSAYARPGFQCRHNRNYWEFGDYLGIGAGAHGKITHADGRIERYSKTRVPKDYMSADNSAIANRATLATSDIPGEYILNALRLNEGFSLQHFHGRTGCNETALQPQLDQLCEKGLLLRDNSRITTTDLGRRFLDSVIADFLN